MGLWQEIKNAKPVEPGRKVTPENASKIFRELLEFFEKHKQEPPDASIMIRDNLREVPQDARPLFYDGRGIPVFNSRERVGRYIEFHNKYESDNEKK